MGKQVFYMKKALAREQLFLWGLSLYIISYTIFNYSLYGLYYGNILLLPMKSLRWTAYLFFSLSILSDQYRRNYLLIYMLLFGLSIVIFLFSDSTILFMVFILISSHNIDFSKILRVALNISVLCAVFIIISRICGIITPETMYMRGNGVVRDTLGYAHPNTASSIILYLMFIYTYLKGHRLKLNQIGVMLIISICVFHYTDSKTVFLLSSIFLFVILCLKYIRKFVILMNAFTIILRYIYIILAAAIILISYSYTPHNKLMAAINVMLNQRLRWGQNAINHYGFHLFGQKILWQSIGVSDDVYNYVDSSYLYMAINYGIIWFIIVCIGCTFMMKKAIKCKDLYLILILTIIAIHAAIEPALQNLIMNPFLFLVMSSSLKSQCCKKIKFMYRRNQYADC